MCDYLTNQEMREKLYELNETYWNEDLISLSSLGKSVLGEELYYLKIPDRRKVTDKTSILLLFPNSNTNLSKVPVFFLSFLWQCCFRVNDESKTIIIQGRHHGGSTWYVLGNFRLSFHLSIYVKKFYFCVAFSFLYKKVVQI